VLGPEDSFAALEKAGALVAGGLRAAPKSTRWQLRAKVGRRKRWYGTPEEVVR
jgi:hypothetical protein